MRLYRGLKQPYKPEWRNKKVAEPAQRQETNFTDCPYIALLYACSPRGVVLVVDVEQDSQVRVSEEFWFDRKAKRFMIRGKFDPYIHAVIPAKELRAEVRRKGIVCLSDQDKSAILKHIIEQRLNKQAGISASFCARAEIDPSRGL